MSKLTRARSIAFRVPVSKELVADYRRIVEARKSLDKNMADLLAEASKHPEIITASRLAGYDNKPTVEPDSNGQSWLVRLTVHEAIEEAEKPAASYRPYVAPLNLDPKTINLLLNGNIITDAEKKKLIQRLAPDVFDAPSAE